MANFIQKKMRMTHIYQPIMIKTLLESNDTARVEDIARGFLNEDKTQLNYYMNIVRRWPHDTLIRKHKIAKYDKAAKKYTLLLDDVSQQQRRRLIEMCELRLQEFIDRDPWIQKFRELDRRSMSGSLRYDILAKSKGVCVACGAKSQDAFLHVDHIIPVSLGGVTEPYNLQALCDKCNMQKRNRDDTDFLLWQKRLEFRHVRCDLCKKPSGAISNSMAYAIKDRRTRSLIIPHRHVESFVDMIPAEKQLCLTLVDQVIERMKRDLHADRFDVHGLDGAHSSGHCCISITQIQRQ